MAAERPTTHPRVYVASPLGFSEVGRAYYATVLEALRKASLEPLDPWVSFDPVKAIELLRDVERAVAELSSLSHGNEEAGKENARMIREEADGMLAILDGPDVDSGTAAEIGYASALEIPIVGLKTDVRYCGDNVATPVNLQVAHFISASNGVIAYSLDAAVAALAARVTGPA